MSGRSGAAASSSRKETPDVSRQFVGEYLDALALGGIELPATLVVVDDPHDVFLAAVGARRTCFRPAESSERAVQNPAVQKASFAVVRVHSLYLLSPVEERRLTKCMTRRKHR